MKFCNIKQSVKSYKSALTIWRVKWRRYSWKIELRATSIVHTVDDNNIIDGDNHARKRKLKGDGSNDKLNVSNTESACSSKQVNFSANSEKRRKMPVQAAQAASTPVAAKNKKKKVLQAIDTNVFEIRQNIIEAKCKNFSVTQANVNAPVKITIADENEVDLVKSAFNAAKVSYHEFKSSDEKSACFLIKGLVGLINDDLSDVKSQLIQQGLPQNIELSIYTASYMRKHPNKQHNTLVRLITPPKFDVNLLNNIKYLSHVGIKFEKFKKQQNYPM